MTLEFLDWFVPAAIRAGDADLRRRARVLVAVALVFGAVGAVLAVVALVLRMWTHAAGTSIGMVVPFVLLLGLRRGTPVAVLGAVAGAFASIIVIQGAIAFGGVGAPSLNWLAMIPMLVLLVSGPRYGIAFAIAVVVIHTGFFAWGHRAGKVALAVVSVDGVAEAAVVFSLAFAYETSKRRALVEIRDAHAEILGLQARLVDAAHAAGMAEIATSVVHDAGNALNHVSTAVGLANERIASLQFERLDKVSLALGDPARSEADRKLATYVAQVADLLREQRAAAAAELARLSDGVEHIAAIIDSHQQHAGNSEHLTAVDLKEAIQGVVYLERVAWEAHQVALIVELDDLPLVRTSKYKLVLVVTNLVRNAFAAVVAGPGPREIRVRLHRVVGPKIRIEVHDTGIGITPEHQAQIFHHGFTTKPGGHGFGLHGSAIAAKELGGTLTFHSDGEGRGARFVLELPVTPVPVAAG